LVEKLNLPHFLVATVLVPTRILPAWLPRVHILSATLRRTPRPPRYGRADKVASEVESSKLMPKL
jgi:hypothetical protein